jgi:Protein of unknown function (DUF2569)
MFCGHCGQPNPDSNTHCASCGKEMKLALNMAPAPAAAPAPAPVSPQGQLSGLENYSGPKGVGGWLLLFCLGTTILTPVMLLREAMNNSSDLTVVAIDIGLTVLALSTGIALWSHSRYALPLVRAYFIAQLALAVLIILANTVGSAAAGPQSSGNFVYQGIRTFLVVALWWSYFHKSERVLATYGRNL